MVGVLPFGGDERYHLPSSPRETRANGTEQESWWTHALIAC
jgi:hypothetical protein